VDKSLIRRESGRFWMLETLREYGRAQLDDAQLEDVVERHGAFYERFAGEAMLGMRGRDAGAWLRRIEEELPNLRAAMGRALERGLPARAARIASDVVPYWEARSASTEGRSWLDRALTDPLLSGADRAAAACRSGAMAFFQGDVATAAELLPAAAALAHDA